ncbi:MAG: MBL fold metallo-hydrolase [Oscillospiraceae bacterium]|nr:MBL fold metallo-hydrolase [Oscillospiraceae bacterium]
MSNVKGCATPTGFEVTFLGVSGSCAHNNGNRAKYGTNSLCVAVEAGGETLIFDAGTGICGAQSPNKHTHIFFTHYHTDHISGLLFYPELFNPQKRFSFYGFGDVRATIDKFLSPPLHPVGLNVFGAELDFINTISGNTITISDKVSVKTCDLSHPGGAIGYRVEYDGKSFCYCVDCELANHQDDEKLLEFTQGADLLVLDSFFDDGRVIPGWGHSSWRECAEWAKRVEAKQLALFHHSFKWTDDEIEVMEAKAKEVFPCSFAASDFMQVKLV